MRITVEPVGYVSSSRLVAADDGWHDRRVNYAQTLDPVDTTKFIDHAIGS